MRFPARKDSIVALAEQMISGISANTAAYPESIFATANITATLTNLKTLISQRQARTAAKKTAVEAENAGFDALSGDMKKLLYMAEVYHGADAGMLSAIGWSVSGTPSANPPVQPDDLTLTILDYGQIRLSWKMPRLNSGGTVRFYRVERQQKTADGTLLDWGVDKTYSSISREIVLPDQPEKVELHYRVIAVNAAGESTPSNVVRGIL